MLINIFAEDIETKVEFEINSLKYIIYKYSIYENNIIKNTEDLY